MADINYIIPGSGIIQDRQGGRSLIIPGSGVYQEQAAAAATTTIYVPQAYVPNQKPLLGQRPNLAHPSRSGLVGNWNFNEGSGNTVYDDSGNGNNGTINNADWVVSERGPTLSTDSTANNGVNFGNLGLQVAGLGFWFQNNNTVQTTMTANRPIGIDGTNEFIVFGGFTGLIANEIITLASSTGNVRISYASASDTYTGWHHCFFRWTGATYEIYLDGLRVDNAYANVASVALYTADNFEVLHAGLSVGWDGEIDAVKIYNRILTPSEVLADYLDSYAAYQPDPIIVGVAAAEPPVTGFKHYWALFINRILGAR